MKINISTIIDNINFEGHAIITTGNFMGSSNSYDDYAEVEIDDIDISEIDATDVDGNEIEITPPYIAKLKLWIEENKYSEILEREIEIRGEE